MARPPAPQALASAAAQRTLEAERRVRCALRELDREGSSVTFVAVAGRAQVSRAFLYARTDFRAEIEQLRRADGGAPPRLPAAQRASEASLRTRLRAAVEEVQHQRQELARLREELAIAHGRVRELELERRTGLP